MAQVLQLTEAVIAALEKELRSQPKQFSIDYSQARLEGLAEQAHDYERRLRRMLGHFS